MNTTRRLAAWTAIFVSACGAPAATPSDADMTMDLDSGMLPMDLDSGPTHVSPVLESAMARQTGRFGDDLRIDVRASDGDGDATSLSITLRTAAGIEIKIYDTDADGVLDSGSAIFPLIAPIEGSDVGDGVVVLAGMHHDEPDVAKIEVAVVDGGGNRSEPMAVDVVEQPVIAVDGLCDVDYVENRCEDGFACHDAVPAICAAGVAPTLTRVGYFTDPGTVRVMVEGEDVDQDVTQIRIEFLDAEGAAVMIDLDGDSVPEATSFVDDVRVVIGGNTFFYRFMSSDEFARTVASVRVVAIDRGTHESAPMSATGVLTPTKSTGQECDPRGFDRCSNSVCTPGTVGATNHCTAYSVARPMACASAPTINPFASESIHGETAAASLWDAPSGCTSGDPVGRPEGLVKVHLDHSAAHLVLTTDDGYSNFDTVIYLIASCDGTPVVAWCADDIAEETGDRTRLSRLTLENVPAGDYFLVVDSFSPDGGRFALSSSAD